MDLSEFPEPELRRKNKVTKLDSIRKACKLSDQVFLLVAKNISSYFTEKEVARMIKEFIREKKAKLSFLPIVASGKNAFNIHHKPTEKKLKEGEPIVLDFGAKIGGYCADLTRTVFLKKASKKFKNIYRIVLSAQKKSLQLLSTERQAKKIDQRTRDFIVQKKYGKNFLHTLGHSLGRKPHAGIVIGPGSKDLLKKGDIVAIEPGIYIKGEGGVRIEDDILIKEKSIEVLTKTPKELNQMIIE